MKLLLVLGAIVIHKALAQGFGTVVPHEQNNLCLYAVNRALIELRECPTQIEIEQDDYPENFKWHYQEGRLYNYELGECIAEDSSDDFVGVDCDENDNNQRFGFIPVHGHSSMILHFTTSDCMQLGNRISNGRFQLDAANGCDGRDEQLFKIPYFDENDNEFWDDLD
jgi:hypothetical protein